MENYYIEKIKEVPHTLDKWSWKMEYCKACKIPPAQSWAWYQAEEAFNKAIGL